jgi:hypothetical protein
MFTKREQTFCLRYDRRRAKLFFNAPKKKKNPEADRV